MHGWDRSAGVVQAEVDLACAPRAAHPINFECNASVSADDTPSWAAAASTAAPMDELISRRVPDRTVTANARMTTTQLPERHGWDGR
jgi:hypothetical protein